MNRLPARWPKAPAASPAPTMPSPHGNRRTHGRQSRKARRNRLDRRRVTRGTVAVCRQCGADRSQVIDRASAFAISCSVTSSRENRTPDTKKSRALLRFDEKVVYLQALKRL